MALNIGWAWILGICFSFPVWAMLVYFWGIPSDLIEVMKFAGIAGFIQSIIAIVMIFWLKVQARKP